MRALLLVLDGVGIGGAPDAAAYGDEGANTLGHILEQASGLRLPYLDSLGLGALLGGTRLRESRIWRDDPSNQTGLAEASPSGVRASHGRMRSRSAGKDTMTGHWELAGAILDEPFPTFATFAEKLVRQIEQAAEIKFIGNYASSGTEILNELGAEHLKTRRPILYTSADSVLQIASHEDVIPIERLYAICECARKFADYYRIGRVIARPFIGEALNFQRTSRRHDFSLSPPRTILDESPRPGSERSAISSRGAALRVHFRPHRTAMEWSASRSCGRQRQRVSCSRTLSTSTSSLVIAATCRATRTRCESSMIGSEICFPHLA